VNAGTSPRGASAEGERSEMESGVAVGVGRGGGVGVAGAAVGVGGRAVDLGLGGGAGVAGAAVGVGGRAVALGRGGGAAVVAVGVGTTGAARGFAVGGGANFREAVGVRRSKPRVAPEKTSLARPDTSGMLPLQPTATAASSAAVVDRTPTRDPPPVRPRLPRSHHAANDRHRLSRSCLRQRPLRRRPACTHPAAPSRRSLRGPTRRCHAGSPRRAW
jgi:hypothetical protein